MLNVEMYTQMGFSENLVKRAHEYSRKNGIDMFDALQQLQQADRERISDGKKNKIPNFSYLKPLKAIRVSDYEVIYSRTGVQNSHLERE